MGGNFSVEQVPPVHGKTFVVTGANAGIGYHTAKTLAMRGGNVILCCRSQERANEAIAKIKSEIETANIPDAGTLEFLALDLQSLKSCEAAARTLLSRKQTIHVLINNAGIMATPFALTKDGIEAQFATNYMGHFVLTMLLLPLLPRDGTGRIVNVSSIAHNTPYSQGLLDIDQIMVKSTPAQGEKSEPEKVYSSWPAYGQSKLANVLFTRFLAEKSPTIQAYSVHPGWVDTELFKNIRESYGIIADWIFKAIGALVATPPSKGALSSLCAATHVDLGTEKAAKWAPNGTYFVPHGRPSTPSAMAQDKEMGDKMWELSVEITKRVLGDKVTKEIQDNLAAAATAGKA
ncbi:hypothetical protein BCR44DRAFT_47828 [Catenaria anguillulae PL171]|uniref:NAD(P)-binding protein n=1 Tax=Catenaria anguillulae PL171 TaxID=765915 RepID=A0A1Y2I3D8_9FUNG|nr:hypothetical protein BCR44DRAFT_47828 [Catenaria anguillulae PL171]